MQRQVMQRGRWWRAWYSTARWREMRKRLLQRKPYCLYCKKREGRIVKATVADHIIPHKGNPALFWDEDNLQSLCKRCHDSDKAREEAGGRVKVRFGADGYPIMKGGGE